MAPAAMSGGQFSSSLVAGLEEPVRRYFAHAIAEGSPLTPRVRLDMSGRIRVGAWLRFTSVWEGDGRSFDWRATAGPFSLLRVHDRFDDGVGFMDIRLRPALKLLHAQNDDVARSGAGRAALEALWTPAALLPGRGVSWRAESDERIVATFAIPPETPELHIAIDREGAVRSYHAQRWRDTKSGYQPFGAEIHAERSFAGLTIPSRFTAGWGYETPSWAPFFKAQVTALVRVGAPSA